MHNIIVLSFIPRFCEKEKGIYKKVQTQIRLFLLEESD